MDATTINGTGISLSAPCRSNIEWMKGTEWAKMLGCEGWWKTSGKYSLEPGFQYSSIAQITSQKEINSLLSWNGWKIPVNASGRRYVDCFGGDVVPFFLLYQLHIKAMSIFPSCWYRIVAYPQISLHFSLCIDTDLLHLLLALSRTQRHHTAVMIPFRI